jgi:murein DD-endopeptidase MepM/ murein hydrolase activator NlpD
MDFHFRDQKTDTNYNGFDNASQTASRSLINFLGNYLRIRSRQIRILSTYFVMFSGIIIVELKNLIVRNIYWGRTSLYKTSFHVIIIMITIFALYTGLGSRIISGQNNEISDIRVNSRTVIDVDLIAQQGSFIPLEEISSDSDSVYFEYTVQAGDNLSSIASKNEINADTLRWANNIPNGRDTLKVGQVIKVPRMNGVLYEIKKGDTVDKILAKVKGANKLTFLELNSEVIDSSGNPIPGSIAFIPDATLPRQSTGGVFIPQPINPVNVTPGAFTNPMQLCSYSFSRGYYYGHTGVDLGTNRGCWVVSAANGVVSHAGSCGDLGFCIVVVHANGFSTVYGHGNGVFAVKRGQAVAAGQRIMQSGCTGKCYGPHVHVSLAANGNDVLNCYRCRINPAGIIPY